MKDNAGMLEFWDAGMKDNAGIRNAGILGCWNEKRIMLGCWDAGITNGFRRITGFISKGTVA